MEKEVLLDTDWLPVGSYQFKILVMVAVLAENHLAYRGTIKDMCEFLGVKNETRNRRNIETAIKELENEGLVKTIIDKKVYTITLSRDAEKKKGIIKLKNNWIKLIKEYKAANKEDSVSWDSVLKVLTFLIADLTEIKKYKEIGEVLNISDKTVERSIKALESIDFEDVVINRKIAWLYNSKSKYKFKVVGQKIEVGYNFN